MNHFKLNLMTGRILYCGPGETMPYANTIWIFLTCVSLAGADFDITDLNGIIGVSCSVDIM